MPAEDITLVVNFVKKMHDITVDNEPDVQLSAPNASVRETITVSLSDAAVQAGKKISSVTVTAQQGEYGTQYEIAAVKGADGTWSFTIPTAVGSTGDVLSSADGVSLETTPFNFHVAATIAEKAIAVTAGNIAYGTATLRSGKADAGETVTFTLKANADGYKFQRGFQSISKLTQNINARDRLVVLNAENCVFADAAFFRQFL